MKAGNAVFFIAAVLPAADVGLWDRFEIPIENTRTYASPYNDVTLNATFIAPDGERIFFWGFHDGGTTWKLRFMPDRPGEWRYEAVFSDGAPGASGSFRVTGSDIPGLIGVDEYNPIWFGYKGGRHTVIRRFHVGDRFFAANWSGEKRTAFLDWLQGQRYNMLSIASHYLNRDVDDRGRGWDTPKLWPLDAGEYRRMELILDDLARRKILVFPFAGFFGKESNYPRDPVDQERYVRYTLARLGPYWNLLFNTAGPEPNLRDHWMNVKDVERLGRLIQRLDPFGHVVSVHNRTGDDPYAASDWTDYGVLQGPKTVNRRRLAGALAANHHRAKPLYSQETLWPGNTLHKEPYTNVDIRKNAIVMMMSGAAINFGDMKGLSSSGFTGTMELADRVQERHDIIAKVWDYFESVPYWRMVARPELVDNGYCLAEVGQRYLVYLEAGGTVNVRVADGPYVVRWVNAQDTADVRYAGSTRDGSKLAAPAGSDDWLLDLSREMPGGEIATGKMLGSGHEARSFYVRERGSSWGKTYSGRQYRPEAAGRLMNLRPAQGLFHDEWMTEIPFDPEDNTNRLIEALDVYKEHGILAVSVSLQGGNPAYERFPQIKRDRPNKLGFGKGALISAFHPDGSLKDAWMDRLLRLIRELGRRGMFLDLLYYYQHQDEVLSGPKAIDAGVRNVTDWLIDNDCRNVIIEIANEYDVGSYDHDRYIFRRMDHLIELARGRFAARRAPFRLPVSASTGGSMKIFDSVKEHADLVILHGNNRTPEEKRVRVFELAADSSMPGPIYMNEDNNGRETTIENLRLELASCDAVFRSGGSWGYMPWVQAQNFPFRYFLPGASADVRDDMPVEQRDPAYFKAVLMHIRGLLMR
jgi:hypothetical protein